MVVDAFKYIQQKAAMASSEFSLFYILAPSYSTDFGRCHTGHRPSSNEYVCSFRARLSEYELGK